MHRVSLLFLVLLLTASNGAGATTIGFREVEIQDPEGRRPLHVSLWYATEDQGSPVEIGSNAAFSGVMALRDAAPTADSRPLVLLSHGMGGSWRNLSWLAGELVRAGFAVAAPDHPGTTIFDRRPEEAARLSQRPRDLSRVLDAVLADSNLLGRIQTMRIAVVGHSLGGWTAVALAGGRFDMDVYDRQCHSRAETRICGALKELGVLGNASERMRLAGEMRDPRLSAFVALDPGAMQGFTSSSLKTFDNPILLMTAGTETPEIAASRADASYIAPYLARGPSRHIEIPDATHFSFVQLCKSGAAALIEEESPGESFVCRDGGRRERIEIHRQIAEEVTRFLMTTLPSE